ncbi:MAG: hypothetical protein Q8Q18_02105 [bacterium]|nr:hypothetical protein [bacterium]
MASYELIVNSGSASKKYGLSTKGVLLASAHLEHSTGGLEFSISIGDKKRVHTITADQKTEAPLIFISQCVKHGLLNGVAEVTRVLFRIVAPSSHFASHKVITTATKVRLRSLEALAVSHIRPILEDIEDIEKMFVGRALVGISDSAYHRTMPEIARTYALDPELAATHDVYRFGYHGLSVAGIVRELYANKRAQERMIVIHVGGGVSVTAVRDGLSVETSMGFMPLTGVPMATRAFDLDVGGFIQLMLHSGEGTERLIRRLYHESGLINYANIGHGGFKELLVASKVGNHNATQALSKYSYHMRKEIAAQVAVLGGVDMIILTGTALSRSPRLRQMTLDGLKHLGIQLDMDKNREPETEGVISVENSSIIEILGTREMNEMASIVEEMSFYTIPN